MFRGIGRGMRTCLANARQNLGVRALKCPRLKDSSNPFTILQKEKRTLHECSFSFGRGIRIRTLNNGVRVRCVTVTLYLYIMICTINAFTIITYKNNLSSFILKF